MDDLDYRAQLIEQNCCYNQPPHLGYNLRESKKITAETIEVEGTPEKYGKYWGAIYTSYPVIVPEGVTILSVTNYEYKEGYDTLKVTEIPAGKIISGNKGFVFNSTVKNPVFVPSAKTTNANPSTTYVKGFYSDSTVVVTATQAAYKYVYEFRNGDRGVGFYKTDGTWRVPGGTPYGLFGYSADYPGAESYVFGSPYNNHQSSSIRGDVNGDGIVNGTDIQAVINFIIVGEYDKKADVNEDDLVNGTDIQEIINIILTE